LLAREKGEAEKAKCSLVCGVESSGNKKVHDRSDLKKKGEPEGQSGGLVDTKDRESSKDEQMK